MELSLDSAKNHTYYRMKTDPVDGNGISPVNEYIWDLLIELDGKKVLDSTWSTQLCMVEDNLSTKFDFFSFGGLDFIPVFNNRAYLSTRKVLEQFGEFLKLESDSRVFWLYNCTTIIDIVEMKASNIIYDDGYIVGIKELVFDKCKLREGAPPIFRAREFEKEALFVTEQITNIIERNGLRGIELTRVPVVCTRHSRLS